MVITVELLFGLFFDQRIDGKQAPEWNYTGC